MENEALQNEVLQTEKDTIDVVGYLKRQDEEKDVQVNTNPSICCPLLRMFTWTECYPDRIQFRDVKR